MSRPLAFVLPLLCAAFLLGCNDGGTSPAPGLAGTYVLVSVDGRAIPTAGYDVPCGRGTVQSAELRLSPNGANTLSGTWTSVMTNFVSGPANGTGCVSSVRVDNADPAAPTPLAFVITTYVNGAAQIYSTPVTRGADASLVFGGLRFERQ